MVKIFRFDSEYDDEFCSNSYVIGEKGGPFILVDIGSTSDRILSYVKDNHTSCLGVLLTHGHFDHIRGLEKFLSYYDCTVFIDKDEEEKLHNSRLNCSKMNGEDLTIELNNVYLLDDEDEINFINKYYIKVIETPFHTNGSVCYLLKSENALFSGDTLFKGSIGRSDLPTSSNRTIVESLKKIKKLDPSLTVYPGHGEITTLKKELENNIYLKEIKND